MTDFEQLMLEPKDPKANEDFDSTANVLSTSKDIVFDRQTSIGPGFCGTYTPEILVSANCTVTEVYECQFMRLGTMVLVSGIMRIDPNALGDSVAVHFTLPIVSKFRDPVSGSTRIQLAGSGFGSIEQGVAIRADSTRDCAEMTFAATSTANPIISFMFMYQIIK